MLMLAVLTVSYLSLMQQAPHVGTVYFLSLLQRVG